MTSASAGPDEASRRCPSVTDWEDADRRRHEAIPSSWAAASCTAGRSPCSFPTGGTEVIPGLGQQIARLQRSCHRLIWLNPLIGTAGYAPLTRGLQAALPFVDDFLPVRTLTNLEQLAIHLNTLA